MYQVCCLHIWGAVVCCSLVNTELKYVLSVLAISLSVVTICPVGVLSGPTFSNYSSLINVRVKAFRVSSA